MNAGKNAF